MRNYFKVKKLREVPKWENDESWAQGHGYFIKAGNFVKIGCSTDPEKRLRAIQTGNPHKCELLYSIYNEDMFEMEQWVQMELKKYHIRGEWYRLTPKVREYITLVKKYNRLFPFDWIVNKKRNPHNPIFNGEWLKEK